MKDNRVGVCKFYQVLPVFLRDPGWRMAVACNIVRHAVFAAWTSVAILTTIQDKMATLKPGDDHYGAMENKPSIWVALSLLLSFALGL
jgi:hypothetical protein